MNINCISFCGMIQYFIIGDSSSVNRRIRNDNNDWDLVGKQWSFAERNSTASSILHKILSFRALARNLTINCYKIIIDN
jgi:hypothetical protein